MPDPTQSNNQTAASIPLNVELNTENLIEQLSEVAQNSEHEFNQSFNLQGKIYDLQVAKIDATARQIREQEKLNLLLKEQEELQRKLNKAPSSTPRATAADHITNAGKAAAVGTGVGLAATGISAANNVITNAPLVGNSIKAAEAAASNAIKQAAVEGAQNVVNAALEGITHAATSAIEAATANPEQAIIAAAIAGTAVAGAKKVVDYSQRNKRALEEKQAQVSQQSRVVDHSNKVVTSLDKAISISEGEVKRLKEARDLKVSSLAQDVKSLQIVNESKQIAGQLTQHEKLRQLEAEKHLGIIQDSVKLEDQFISKMKGRASNSLQAYSQERSYKDIREFQGDAVSFRGEYNNLASKSVQNIDSEYQVKKQAIVQKDSNSAADSQIKAEQERQKAIQESYELEYQLDKLLEKQQKEAAEEKLAQEKKAAAFRQQQYEMEYALDKALTQTELENQAKVEANKQAQIKETRAAFEAKIKAQLDAEKQAAEIEKAIQQEKLAREKATADSIAQARKNIKDANTAILRDKNVQEVEVPRAQLSSNDIWEQEQEADAQREANLKALRADLAKNLQLDIEGLQVALDATKEYQKQLTLVDQIAAVKKQLAHLESTGEDPRVLQNKLGKIDNDASKQKASFTSAHESKVSKEQADQDRKDREEREADAKQKAANQALSKQLRDAELKDSQRQIEAQQNIVNLLEEQYKYDLLKSNLSESQIRVRNEDLALERNKLAVIEAEYRAKKATAEIEDYEATLGTPGQGNPGNSLGTDSFIKQLVAAKAEQISLNQQTEEAIALSKRLQTELSVEKEIKESQAREAKKNLAEELNRLETLKEAKRDEYNLEKATLDQQIYANGQGKGRKPSKDEILKVADLKGDLAEIDDVIRKTKLKAAKDPLNLNVKLEPDEKATLRQIHDRVKAAEKEKINLDIHIDKSKQFSLFKEFKEGIANQFGSLFSPDQISQTLIQGFTTATSFLKDEIGKVLNEFAKYEAQQATATVVTGDPISGQKSIDFVQQVSLDTKTDFDSNIDGYNKLYAAMSSVTDEQGKLKYNAEDINFIFEKATKINRALNLSAEQSQGTFEAYTQIFSKNRVQAEELRGQLGDRLPGAVGLFAKALGILPSELDELLKSGKVTADSLFDFVREGDAKFGSQLPAALKTTSAAIADVGNRFQIIQREFGEAINPFQQATIQAAADILKDISDTIFVQLNEQAKEFQDYLEANPEIIESISDAITLLLSQGLNYVADKTREALEYLKQNPQAVQDAIDKTVSFVEGLGKVVTVTENLVKNWQTFADIIDYIINALPGLRAGIELARGAWNFVANNGTGANPANTTAVSTGAYDVAKDFYYDNSPEGSYDFTLSQDGKYNVSIPSPVSGKVTDVGNDPSGYGNYVEVTDSSTGMSWFMAHLESVAVKMGDEVQRGTALGVQGTTGNSTGEHIHLEISDRNGNRIIDRGVTAPLVDDYTKNLSSNTYGGSSSHPEGNAGTTPPSSTPAAFGTASNWDRYASRLAARESSLNADPKENPEWTHADGGPRGGFQFTADTRQEAINWGVGDPWAGTLQDQARVTRAYIERWNPAALAAIDRGDWAEADRLIGQKWSSVTPGGHEEQAGKGDEYLTSNSPPIIGTGGAGSTASASSTPNHSGKDDVQAAREEADKSEKEKADKEAERIKKEAESLLSQEGKAKAQQRRDAATSARERANADFDQKIAEAADNPYLQAWYEYQKQLYANNADFQDALDTNKEAQQELELKIKDLEDDKVAPANESQKQATLQSYRDQLAQLKKSGNDLTYILNTRNKTLSTNFLNKIKSDLKNMEKEFETWKLEHQATMNQLQGQLLSTYFNDEYIVGVLDTQTKAQALADDLEKKTKPLQDLITQTKEFKADFLKGLGKTEEEVLKAGGVEAEQLKALNRILEINQEKQLGILAEGNTQVKIILAEREKIERQHAREIADIRRQNEGSLREVRLANRQRWENDFQDQLSSNENTMAAEKDRAAGVLEPLYSQRDDIQSGIQAYVEANKDKEGTEAYIAAMEAFNKRLNEINEQIAINERISNETLAGLVSEKRKILEEQARVTQQALQDSQYNLQDAQASLLTRDRGEYAAVGLQRSVGAARINSELRETIRSMKEAGTLTPEIQANLEALADINLSNLTDQFKSLGQVIDDTLGESFKGMFKDLVTSAWEGNSVLQVLGNTLSNLAGKLADLAINQLFTDIFGAGLNLFGDTSKSSGPEVLGVGLGDILGAFGGGLPKFANGGVLDKATVGLVGEAGPEAIIPLPNGRHVPVQMNGKGMGGNVNSNITVNVASNGNTSVSGNSSADFAKKLKSAVIQTVLEERRPGGSLYGT